MPVSYFIVTFKTAAVPVLILSILLQNCTEFLIVKMIKRESLLLQKAQTAGTVSLLNSKNQDRITMQTNTQHKLLSVRAIQKEKLLHYLLVKTRSRDKATGDLKTQAQRHWPQQEPEWQESIKTVENGGWTCKLFTFIINQGGRADWKQVRNCSALQQGSEGQTQLETMHSNEHFLNSWKIRFSTSLNPTKILNCSKKESVRDANCRNIFFYFPGRASQVQVSKKVLGQASIIRKK